MEVMEELIEVMAKESKDEAEATLQYIKSNSSGGVDATVSFNAMEKLTMRQEVGQRILQSMPSFSRRSSLMAMSVSAETFTSESRDVEEDAIISIFEEYWDLLRTESVKYLHAFEKSTNGDTKTEKLAFEMCAKLIGESFKRRGLFFKAAAREFKINYRAYIEDEANLYVAGLEKGAMKFLESSEMLKTDVASILLAEKAVSTIDRSRVNLGFMRYMETLNKDICSFYFEWSRSLAQMSSPLARFLICVGDLFYNSSLKLSRASPRQSTKSTTFTEDIAIESDSAAKSNDSRENVNCNQRDLDSTEKLTSFQYQSTLQGGDFWPRLVLKEFTHEGLYQLIYNTWKREANDMLIMSSMEYPHVAELQSVVQIIVDIVEEDLKNLNKAYTEGNDHYDDKKSFENFLIAFQHTIIQRRREYYRERVIRSCSGDEQFSRYYSLVLKMDAIHFDRLNEDLEDFLNFYLQCGDNTKRKKCELTLIKVFADFMSSRCAFLLQMSDYLGRKKQYEIRSLVRRQAEIKNFVANELLRIIERHAGSLYSLDVEDLYDVLDIDNLEDSKQFTRTHYSNDFDDMIGSPHSKNFDEHSHNLSGDDEMSGLTL